MRRYIGSVVNINQPLMVIDFYYVYLSTYINKLPFIVAWGKKTPRIIPK